MSEVREGRSGLPRENRMFDNSYLTTGNSGLLQRLNRKTSSVASGHSRCWGDSQSDEID